MPILQSLNQGQGSISETLKLMLILNLMSQPLQVWALSLQTVQWQHTHTHRAHGGDGGDGCQGLRPSLSNVDSDEESGGWTGLCFDRTFGTEVTILARCCFQIFWHIRAFKCVLKHMSSINLNNHSQIYSIYWIHMENIFLILAYMFTRLSYL